MVVSLSFVVGDKPNRTVKCFLDRKYAKYWGKLADDLYSGDLFVVSDKPYSQTAYQFV